MKGPACAGSSRRASAPIATISAAELISAIDAALYAAKRNGRNQIWPPLLRESETPRRDGEAVVIPLAGLRPG